MRRLWPLVISFLLLLSTLTFYALPALAGDARLFLSPSSGIKYVGSTFTVSVKVNSGSHTTNAYKAVVKFPTSLLTATGASVGSSICTIQIPPSPSYNNSTGTVNFECGHPGYFSGSSGTIGVITFYAKAAGTANLSFSTANIKAADGSGTEVLGSTGGASFTLQPAPLAGPIVSSTTHPNQNSWYPERTATLSWTKPAGADGFSYVFDNKSGTIPDDVSEGTASAGDFTAGSDGIHYLHIKAHDSNGWGSTTHFRVQIDTTLPDPFEVTSEPPAENVTAAPLIIAKAVDRPSGIDHYEISLDGEGFAPVPGMPYQYGRIAEGTHTITVRAVDKAGNYRDSSLVIHVIDVEDPVITAPADGSYIPILESILIQGTAPAGIVELYLNDELIAQVETVDGKFEYEHTGFLRPGPYRLKAVAVTERGITSSPDQITFTVDPRAVSLFGITFPGWLVYSTLLGIIILLLILLFRYLRKVAGFDEHVRQDVAEIEKEAEKDLERAEQELKKAVDDVLERGDRRQIHQLEHELEKRIEKAEGEARQRIGAELDRIRRHHPRTLQKIEFPKFWQKIIPLWNRIPKPRIKIKFTVFWKKKKKGKDKKDKKGLGDRV